MPRGSTKATAHIGRSREWWNWQTRRIQNPVPQTRAGSTPASRTRSGIAQLEERQHDTLEAAGSSPASRMVRVGSTHFSPPVRVPGVPVVAKQGLRFPRLGGGFAGP